MFGWEFPPHVSGGLGTACFGLTKSLVRQGVEILFVVPKLYGDEPSRRLTFINASTIKLNGQSTCKAEPGDKLPTRSLPTQVDPSHPSQQPAQKHFPIITSKPLTYIEVPSTLLPYRSPELNRQPTSIERWNFNPIESQGTIESSTSSFPSTQPAIQRLEQTQDNQDETPNYYLFSGAYGPNLFHEVERYAQVAAEIAKSYTFDVIHSHDWMTFPAGIAAREISKKPLVIHVHATEYDRSGDDVNTNIRALELEGMQTADRIVTVSSWTKKIVTGKFRINEAKVDVLHNGVTRVNRKKIEFKFPIKGPVITFVGRITHQKGPLFFVEAALTVLTKIPDAHFIVVGSGDLLPLMIERVAMYRMSSHFHFTGFAKGPDIDKIWSISDVYVMPSVSEPFGITPLEAAQAGVPVIISKQSGVAEVMPHAITVDFWNVNSLAAHICSVLTYKSLARTLKVNSRAHTRKLTWDRAAQKLKTIYEQVIST